MTCNLLKEDELIKDKHITIVNVINDFYHINRFKWMLECLSEKHGCGGGEATVIFWNDLDDYDKSFYESEFTGVELCYLSDEEIFELKEFYFYIEMGTKNFKENLTEENEKNYIDELLLKIKNFFEL